MLVLGGTVAATAAAWAISGASAEASTSHPGEPVPSVSDLVSDHGQHHGQYHGQHGPLSAVDTLTNTAKDLSATVRGATATGATVKTAIEPTLRKASGGLRRAVTAPTETRRPSKSRGLGRVVHGVLSKVGKVGNEVDTDVTVPLEPIIRPVLRHLPVGGQHDLLGTGDAPPPAGQGAAAHEVVPKHRPRQGAAAAEHHELIPSSSQSAGAPSHHAGNGLRSTADTAFRDYQGTPPSTPTNSGSSSHDGGSSNSHTSAAGAQSDASLLADPALLSSLSPAAHQVKLHLCDAPGTTPD